jgi:integrase
MALTDISIKSAKSRERDYKLADGGGLYLLVTASGGKLWRLKFRMDGIERKLSLGKYPALGLGDARKARDAAKVKIAGGSDPAAAKRRERIAAKLSAATTFDAVAVEYIAKIEREGLAPATISKLNWARLWLRPAIGNRPVDQIEAHELLALLKKQESADVLETAKRTRAFASRVFRYAVATARAKADPASLLRGAIASPKVKNLAAIIDPKRVGELLRAIDVYSGSPLTRLALQLSPHLFVRPGELRQAEWSEFDFEASIWRIPAARMKKRREHVVPLSAQALASLAELKELSGDNRFLFPAQGKSKGCMSENTVNVALRRMGFGADEMTAHGFRAMASTILNESGKWHPDAIERALAHRDSDLVRGTYHRGAHWDERVAMAAWWGSKLDAMRNGADIVKLQHRANANA